MNWTKFDKNNTSDLIDGKKYVCIIYFYETADKTVYDVLIWDEKEQAFRNRNNTLIFNSVEYYVLLDIPKDIIKAE